MCNSFLERADTKNSILSKFGIKVPKNFEELPQLLTSVFNSLNLPLKKEPPVPKIPMDLLWAQDLGILRQKTSFTTSICDDRKQELMYGKMSISDCIDENIGVAGVVSLLWFKKLLPKYALKFIETVLMIMADHGPCVSGAHNTIVTGIY